MYLHAYSSALKTMVERTVAQPQASDPVSVEPAELERRIYRALRELSQTRPRIVEFAPQIALTRALHRDHDHDLDLDLAHTVARAEWGHRPAHLP